MVRTIIVDDELPIREWLKFTFEKLEEPVEICALCTNGQDALEKCVEFRPDLVFTDIKMPGKDGIELLKELQSFPRPPYVVMLTSHDSFEYARRSLKYGADEYILKSEISVESLSRIVHNCMEERGNAPDDAGTVAIGELLRGSDAAARLETLCGESALRNYFVAAAPLRDTHELLNLHRNRALLAGDGVEDVRVFYYDAQTAVALISSASGLSGRQTYALRVREAGAMMQLLGSPLGVSLMRGGAENLPKTVAEAVCALSQCFYATAPRAYYAEECLSSDFDALNERVNRILREISDRRVVRSIGSVRALLEDLPRLRPSPAFMREKLLSVLGGYRFVAFNWNADTVVRAANAGENAVRSAESFHALRADLEAFLNVVEEALGNEYSQYVRLAISDVRENYAHIRRITDVTGKLGLNPEYFCRIFKAETGSTFNTFLTNFRMKTACELLRDTDRKIIEVAQATGYPNLSYFSRVFKGYTGMNPFRYRKENAE